MLICWSTDLSLFSRRRSEAIVCQLLSNLGAVQMVFQIAPSCESSLLFSSVLGSRGTPKAFKTRLGGAFFNLCGPGVPQKASKVNFCSILGPFWGLLLGAFGDPRDQLWATLAASGPILSRFCKRFLLGLLCVSVGFLLGFPWVAFGFP